MQERWHNFPLHLNNSVQRWQQPTTANKDGNCQQRRQQQTKMATAKKDDNSQQRRAKANKDENSYER